MIIFHLGRLSRIFSTCKWVYPGSRMLRTTIPPSLIEPFLKYWRQFGWLSAAFPFLQQHTEKVLWNDFLWSPSQQKRLDYGLKDGTTRPSDFGLPVFSSHGYLLFQTGLAVVCIEQVYWAQCVIASLYRSLVISSLEITRLWNTPNPVTSRTVASS